MADPMTDPGATDAEAAPAPATDGGQDATASADTGVARTTAEPRTNGDEETFFDPREIPAELMPAYKSMQSAFTKKTQAIRNDRQKIEAYNSFMADPVGNMQRLASQYGMTVKQLDAAMNQPGEGKEWEPQSWDEVLERSAQQTLSKLQPALAKIHEHEKSNIERMLDEKVPEWRQHEDEMAALLRQHPTLASNPELLLRVALPSEILERRAYQSAIKKLEAKGKSSQVSGGSKTPQAPKANREASSFAEAYQIARERLGYG